MRGPYRKLWTDFFSLALWPKRFAAFLWLNGLNKDFAVRTVSYGPVNWPIWACVLSLPYNKASYCRWTLVDPLLRNLVSRHEGGQTSSRSTGLPACLVQCRHFPCLLSSLLGQLKFILIRLRRPSSCYFSISTGIYYFSCRSLASCLSRFLAAILDE